MIHFVSLEATPFVTEAVHPDEGHYATRWQFRLVGDSWWPAIHDSGWDTVNKLSYLTTLDDGSYEARVAFMDEFFITSDWSEPIAFELVPAAAPFEDAWAFTLDGHVFYVLNDVNGATLVCDLRTGQWHHWYTGASAGTWNMYRGVMWNGRVLAADQELSKIWELDPASMLDQEEFGITRAVTAFQAIRGKASARVGSFRLTADVGAPDSDGAEVSMRFSDDEGQTWSNAQTRVLASNDFDQVLRFRSLGRLRAPGRIWEIRDTGGAVLIQGADADMEGM